jgi:hypothetical protein
VSKRQEGKWRRMKRGRIIKQIEKKLVSTEGRR